MAVAVASVGVESVGTADSIDVSLPAGDLTGTVLVAYLNNDLAGATAEGWTLIKADAGPIAQHLAVLWRRYDVGVADPVTFDVIGSTAMYGYIVAYSGCAPSGNPVGVIGAVTDASASATVTAATITPTTPDNGIVWVAMAQRVASGMACSVPAGTTPTFTETADDTAQIVIHHSIAVDFGAQTVAVATGERTATLSQTARENQGFMFSLLSTSSVGGGLTEYRGTDGQRRRRR